MLTLAFDNRMARFSGIGTYIRNVLNVWQSQPPQDIDIRLLSSSAPVYSLSEQWSIPLAYRKSGCKGLHVPHYNAPIWDVERCVLTVYDLIHLKFPEFLPSRMARLYAEFFFHRVVPKARGILTISEHTKRDLVELGIPAEKITVTLLGPPSVGQRLPPDRLREELGLMALQEGFFLYIGNLKPFKNVPRLIRVYKSWAEANPGSPPLILAGRNFLPDLKEQLQGSNSIRWVGEVSAQQLIALYQGARAFVFPSLYEGFGLPPLEAMAYGTPVLCSNRASLPEVVGDAALLVDPEDESALRDGFHRLEHDAALRTSLIEKGRIRAASFSWERTAAQTLDVYRKCFS